jgi:hypothetical protein
MRDRPDQLALEIGAINRRAQCRNVLRRPTRSRRNTLRYSAYGPDLGAQIFSAPDEEPSRQSVRKLRS